MPNEFSLSAINGKRGATANLAASDGVSPDQAASAIDTQALTQVPASVGMRTPEVIDPLADFKRQQAVIDQSPAVRQWAATADPAHVAATKDDFGVLASTSRVLDAMKGDGFGKDYWRAVNSIADQYHAAEARMLANPSLPNIGRYAGQSVAATVGILFAPLAELVEPAARGVAASPLTLKQVYLKGPYAGNQAAAPALTNPEARVEQARTQVNGVLMGMFGFGRPNLPGIVSAGAKAAEGGAAAGATPIPPRITPPGVHPAMDELHTAVAELDVAHVSAAQASIAQSARLSSNPAITEQFLAQQTDAVVQVDPEAIAQAQLDGHSISLAPDADVAAAMEAGETVSVPLSRYLAQTSGQPYAEALNKATVFRPDGVALADELPSAGARAPTQRELPVDVSPEEAPRYRALAAEVEQGVDEVVKAQRITELFKDPKALGMSDSQFEAYGVSIDNAIADTTERLLQRAATQIKRERTPEWKERVEQHAASAELRLAESPTLRAYTILSTGKDVLGAPVEANFKLALSDDIALYGRDLGLPRSMFRRDGMSADEAADLLGFPTGADMLKELSALHAAKGDATIRQYVKQLVREEATAATREELGYDLTPDAIREAASEAINGPAITNFLASELETLAAAQGLPFDRTAMQAVADARFGQLQVKDAINIKRLESYVYKGGVKAEKALLKDDLPLAFLRKQQQFIHHLMLKDAFKFAKVYAKAGRNVKRWAKAKSIATMEQGYLNRIHQLLEVHGVPTKRDDAELVRAFGGQTLEGFVESKRNLGQDITYRPTPPKPMNQLTVDEFNALNSTLAELAVNGRREMEVLVNGRKAALNDAVASLYTETAHLPNGSVRMTVGGVRTAPQVAGDYAAKYDAFHRSLESLFESLGPTAEGIMMDGANKAVVAKSKLEREILLPIIREIKTIPKALRKAYGSKVADVPLLSPVNGQPLTILRGQLPSILANMGTASNAQKLAEGYGTTVEAVTQWLDANMRPEEVKFVQFMWDKLSDELFPQADRVAREQRGYGMTKQEAKPLTIAGVRLKGGYWPIEYDRSLIPARMETQSVDLPDEMEKSIAQPFRALSTPTGFEQERTAFVGPILLSLDNVLQSHLRDVFARISYADYIQSARRFVTNPDVRALIEAKAGREQYKLIIPWLEDQVLDVTRAKIAHDPVSSALRKLRHNLTLSVLGFNWSVGAKQALGLLPAVNEIGLPAVLDGTRAFYYDAIRGRLDANMMAHSDEMQFRSNAVEQNIREAREGFNTLDFTQSAPVTALRAYNGVVMRYIGIMDKYTVSGATWYGAMRKAMAEGMDQAQAGRFADKVVRKTQGAGHTKDLLPVQRTGNEAVNMLALMFTWPGRYYNLLRDASTKFTLGDFKGGSRNMFILLVALPIITAWADDELPEHPEKMHAPDWLAWQLRKMAVSVGGATILTRDLANMQDRKADGKYATSGRTALSWAVDQVSAITKKKSKASPTVKLWAGIMGLFGVGGSGQIGKTGQFAADVAARKQKPRDAGDWFEGLTSGKVEK